jgi:hypothetical protein
MTAGSIPSASVADPIAELGESERAALTAVADRLIPSADGMPSAADVLVDDRLRFVLTARPDLLGPVRTALRPELGAEPGARLDALGRDDPVALAALQLLIVAGYYTDRRVRELIGYPGQMAIEVKSWLYPQYLEEGLIDAVLARGAVWRDPATGERARVEGMPKTYADRFAAAESRAGGDDDDDDGA